MKKNNNRSGIIIIGIIALLLIIGVSQFSTIGGLSVISISAPNVISEDQNLANLNWLVTTKLGGGDQIAYTITPSEFKSHSGLATDDPFKITAKGITETLEYRIFLKEDFRIYKYYVTDIMPAGNNCRIISGADLYYESPHWFTFLGYRKFCVLRTWEGRYGTLSSPTIKFEADLIISNNKESMTRKISSSDSSVAFTDSAGKPVVTAEWLGSLVTGNPPPPLPPIGILSTHDSNGWAFVSQSKYTQYQIAQNGFETKVKSFPTTGIVDYQSEVDSLKSQNAQLDGTRMITIYNYDPVSTQYTLVNPTSPTNAMMIYTSKTKINDPLVRWWIRADWLGVERLSGKPQIISISSKRFGNGEQGIITLSVRNAGNTDANFKAVLESCQYFKQTYVSSDFRVNQGATVNTEVYVDAGARNVDTTSTCSVRVFDISNPLNYDTRSVVLGFDATRVCTPGQFSMDLEQNAIFRCNSDGLGLVKVKQCTTSEIVKFTGSGNTGGFECVEKDGSNDGGEEKGSFSWILFFVTLAGSSIIAGYVYTITRGVSHGFKMALAIGVFILSFILIPTLVNLVIGLFTIGKYIPLFSVIP
jgi:hypothetical protein